MTQAWVEHAAASFEVQLTPEQIAQFETYAAQLAEWNERVNLTAITEPEAVRIRHFLDSLSLVQAVPMRPNMRVADVGTGAGLPGLAVAIAYPKVHVHLIESTGKKVRFLDHIVTTLALKNATTLHARAEDAGQNPQYREQYDLVVARAVARLPALLEYLLPLTRVGGHAIAMKGKTAFIEADDSGRALQVLGGRLNDIVAIDLPGVDEPHHLIVVEKIAKTPAHYPRKPGIPTRAPLID
ncbi:MAG: 16S rRNA (guanine(527)-N(7))-methyltransferase RsmG [Chloroflexi bacterium]|nr:MAG: 16S rRNA (guanine(527)-N(7))-methyltransferase RsmG [Chloroflexota bacterium]